MYYTMMYIWQLKLNGINILDCIFVYIETDRQIWLWMIIPGVDLHTFVCLWGTHVEQLYDIVINS